MFSALIVLALQNLLYLALHIEGTGSFPKPLSAAREQECFRRMAAGDTAARNELVEHNLRLVAHIVKKYYAVSAEQEDLISIGTIGLIKAVNTFSYDRGTRFATYAARCIENEILMHFRGLKKNAGDLYLNEELENEGEGSAALSFMNTLSDEESLIEQLDLKLRAARLYESIDARLSDRERTIVRLRYGLGGGKCFTQREIAKRMDISRSYVSRLEKKALGKLKKALES